MAIDLRAGGKLHGVLLDGLLLEVRRGDLVVLFDLPETLRCGHPVYVLRRDANAIDQIDPTIERSEQSC